MFASVGEKHSYSTERNFRNPEATTATGRKRNCNSDDIVEIHTRDLIRILYYLQWAVIIIPPSPFTLQLQATPENHNILVSKPLALIFASLNVCIRLTDKETQAADRHGRRRGDGREASALASLSLHSQQVRAEMFRSLQHMRLQRAKLQSSIEQQRETDTSRELDQNRVSRTEKPPRCRDSKMGKY